MRGCFFWFVCLVTPILFFFQEDLQGNLELERNDIAALSGGCQLLMKFNTSMSLKNWGQNHVRVVTWQLLPVLWSGSDSLNTSSSESTPLNQTPLNTHALDGPCGRVTRRRHPWIPFLDSTDSFGEDKFRKPLLPIPNPSAHQRSAVPVLLFPTSVTINFFLWVISRGYELQLLPGVSGASKLCSEEALVQGRVLSPVSHSLQSHS